MSVLSDKRVCGIEIETGIRHEDHIQPSNCDFYYKESDVLLALKEIRLKRGFICLEKSEEMNHSCAKKECIGIDYISLGDFDGLFGGGL